MLEFLSYLLGNNQIIEFKILTEFNNHAKLISRVFNRKYHKLEELQPNSIYISDIKYADLTENDIIHSLSEISHKSITIVLLHEPAMIPDDGFTDMLIKYGSRYSVSIVSIISEKGLEEIYGSLCMLVNHRYLNELNRTREIYNKFSYLSLKELGLDAIINCFKESIGNPVAVFDIDNKCIASTDKFLNRYHEIKSTAIRYNLYYLYYLSQKIIVEKDGKEVEITQIFFPITIQNSIKAFLCVFEYERKLNDMDYFIMEVAASATLLEMKKRIAMKASEERFTNDLIYDLIHNEPDHDGMLLERSKLIGLNLEERHMVILLEIKNTNIKYEHTNDKVFALISRKIYHQNHYAVVGKLGNNIITLWPLDDENMSNIYNIKELFENILREIIHEFEDISIIIGIGKPVDNLRLIYKSYREAKDAIIMGSTLFSKNAVIGFKDLGVLRLISKVEDRNSLIEIIPEQLIELKKHDEKLGTQLLETLRIYLECNGNASKAAHMLYIHYKTILYRLEKINKICSMDLENYYDRLEVEIGLKLLKILEYDNIEIK